MKYMYFCLPLFIHLAILLFQISPFIIYYFLFYFLNWSTYAWDLSPLQNILSDRWVVSEIKWISLVHDMFKLQNQLSTKSIEKVDKLIKKKFN